MLDYVTAMAWMGAALSLAAALAKTMIPLRVLAASTNVVFVTWAIIVGAYPTLVTHAILLPLNLQRLMQMRRLVRDISSASKFGISADWLAPFSTAEDREAGDILFRRGDKGDKLYYLCSGRIRFEEIDVEISDGALFGEVAFFIPEGERTQTARCATDCRLLSIGEGQLKQLYFQNPQFGWYLVRLVAERLSRNARRIEDERAAAQPLPGALPAAGTAA